jgi:hypothetical protein
VTGKPFRRVSALAPAIAYTKALRDYLKPPTRSYSQYGEDLIVATYFRMRGQRTGYYVDIGAFHPRKFSNTHLLHRAGWHGIVVDVDRRKLRAFEVARRGKVHAIHAAVAPVAGVSTLYRFDRIWSEIDTIDRQTAEQYRDASGVPFTTEEIRAVSINDVLSGAPRIDFLNLDIEGIDVEVLESLDVARFRPQLICFENESSYSCAFLDAIGYFRLASTGGSHIYCESDSTNPDRDVPIPATRRRGAADEPGRPPAC